MKKNTLFSRFTLYGGLILMLVCLQSCFKDNDFNDKLRIDTDPQYAFPLINTTMNIGTSNIIEKLGWGDSSSNFYIDFDENGMIRFHYEIEQSVTIPDEVSYIPLSPIGVPISGVISMPFFKDILEQKFNMEHLRINLVIVNESDNELLLSKKSFYLSNAKEGKTLDVSFDDPFTIKKGFSTNTLPIDINGLNFPPDSLHYDFILKSEASSIAGGKLTIKAEVVIDLFGSFDDIRLNDTISFNLGENASLDSLPDFINVNHLTLQTDFLNGFPLKANIQLYFMNSAYQIIDSLFTDGTQVLGEATIDPVTYKVVKPGTAPTKVVSIDSDRYDVLVKAAYVWIVSDFRSANAPTPKSNIKIFKDNYLNIKMRANLSLGMHGEPDMDELSK